jgi:hypothetical protein
VSSYLISLPLQLSVAPSEVKPEAKKGRWDCDDDPYPNPTTVAKPSALTEEGHCEDRLDKVQNVSLLFNS